MAYRIIPHKSWNSQWWWYAFATEKLVGQTPTFRLSKTDQFQTGSTSHRFGCYATSIDTDTWVEFDTPTIGASDVEFAAAGALPAGTLYIAHYPMYPFSRTTRKVTEWLLETHVTDTASGTDGVVGTATERANGLEGKTAPGFDSYGLKVTDAGSSETKNKAILVSGNHAGETPGRFALEGAVDWLLSGAANAETLLDWFEFYVYPCVDPQGVWGGYYRSTPQNAALNHNRQWNTTGTLESVDTIKAAIAADTGSAINVGIDFHSQGVTDNSGNNYAYVTDKTVAAYAAFQTEMKALEGAEFNLLDNVYEGGELRQLLDTYGTPTLNITPEASGLLSYSVADYKTFGENVMKALYEMLVGGYFSN